MSSNQSNLSAEPDKIRAHAKSILAVNDSVDQALKAAQSATVPADAFGKICAFLPPLFVDTVEQDGVSAIKSATKCLDEDVTSLGKVADGLQTQDTANAAQIKSVHVPGSTT